MDFSLTNDCSNLNGQVRSTGIYFLKMGAPKPLSKSIFNLKKRAFCNSECASSKGRGLK